MIADPNRYSPKVWGTDVMASAVSVVMSLEPKWMVVSTLVTLHPLQCIF